MLESQLQEMKDDMDNSVFKEMVFDQSKRGNVLRKLNSKPKKSINIKLIFLYVSAMLIFTFLVFSNVEGNMGLNATSPVLELVLNEQLMTDAQNGVFSPVPDVSIGMSIDEVKAILGKPVNEEKPDLLDTVLFYDHFNLLFYENKLDFISITNIDHVNKNDLINFFGKPDYEKFIEQRGYGIVTFSVNGAGNAKWIFNCFVNIQDKQTIKEIQFSNAEIRFKED